ncbi:MAG: hypothetical protein M3448_02635 [Pseudomonadota bacterium]|nr:hypothetical protein [Pseudomonadota bacterium]
MRKLMMIAALGLASCSDNQQASNNAVSEETSAADIGPVNDITAIDAATGEAANMAADVDYSFNESEFNDIAANEENEVAGNSGSR